MSTKRFGIIFKQMREKRSCILCHTDLLSYKWDSGYVYSISWIFFHLLRFNVAYETIYGIY